MSRAQRVPEIVRTYIAEMADEHPKWETWRLKKDADEYFEGTGLYVPGPDSIRKTAKAVRGLKVAGDQPWSMGRSQVDVSPDGMADLVKVWKMAVIYGLDFTVRHAKWVARLRSIVVEKYGDNLWELHNWATLYARREKVLAALGKPVDTSDMDAELAFPDETLRVLVDTGRAKAFGVAGRFKTLGHDKMASLLEGVDADEWNDILSDGNLGQEDNPLHYMAAFMQEIPSEAWDVFIIWERELQEGVEDWDEMDGARRFQLHKGLADQVVSYFKAAETDGPLNMGARPKLFRPSNELLDDAGYKKGAKNGH